MAIRRRTTVLPPTETRGEIVGTSNRQQLDAELLTDAIYNAMVRAGIKDGGYNHDQSKEVLRGFLCLMTINKKASHNPQK